MGWAARPAAGLDGPAADQQCGRFRLAVPADEPELRRLLRENPMGGEVAVSFEREPDFFAAAASEGPRHQVAVERRRDGHGLVAMGCRSVRLRYVDGKPRWVPYLGALRVDRPARGRLLGLRRGFALLAAQRRPDETPWALTAIVADNAPALRLLTAGVAGLPRYYPVAELVTLVIPTRQPRRRRRQAAALEVGSPRVLPEIVEFLAATHRQRQFAPVWAATDLQGPTGVAAPGPGDFLLQRERSRVVAALALWDQRDFKQTVVRGYGRRLARWRPLLNLAAPWLGTPHLPAAGTALGQAFLSHLAVAPEADEGTVDLVDAALGRACLRGCDHVLLGLDRRDPLLARLERAFRHRVYCSVLCLVAQHEDAGLLPRTEGKLCYPEVAVL